jgi:hypothetical protein
MGRLPSDKFSLVKENQIYKNIMLVGKFLDYDFPDLSDYPDKG